MRRTTIIDPPYPRPDPPDPHPGPLYDPQPYEEVRDEAVDVLRFRRTDPIPVPPFPDPPRPDPRPGPRPSPSRKHSR